MTKRLSLLAAVALGTLAAIAPSAQAGGKPNPLELSSITPAVADRGGLVTVRGGGLAAGTLELTVGGERVDLFDRRSDRASFRVPALGAVGEVEVVARKPGGRFAEIGLTVRFDGQTAAVADESAAVSVPVGADGGTIAVEGMSLAIPAGAVPEGTEITATPLRSLQGSPFSAAPVGLKLEPSGLVLLRPATLTLPKPSGTGTVVGFGFDGDGDELHLVPAKLAGDTVELKVWHFSGAGTLTARLSELNAVLSYETTRAHGRAEQRIATALIDAAENGSDPGPAIFDALANWRLSVSNGLQVARDAARLDFFELAFGEWQAWQAYVQEYRDSVTPDQASTFDIFIRFDSSLATAAAYDIGLNLLAGCVGPGVPRSALRDVLRLATPVVMAALPIDQANDPSQRQLPTGDGLARACLDIELLTFDHAPTFARNRDNRFTARARVVFWDGPASSTVPLRYRLRDATAGPTPSLAGGTSATGSYEDNITPATLGAHHYELTVDLDTGGGDAVLRAFFDRETEVVPVHERLDLQARRPGDPAFTDSVGAVGPGGTVLLRIRLAGDEAAGKTITLTHDAAGTVAASVTTDTAGEATIVYAAPATEQIELVNATITEGAFTSGDAVVITTRPPVTVTVTPSFGFVDAGRTLQFTATVGGTTDHRVVWNAGGGSISSTGLFTAGATEGVFNVSATSVFDPSVTGTAFVHIAAVTDVTGLYVGGTGSQVGYQCNLTSFVGAGTVCGWFVGQDSSSVPNVAAARCQIETDGTRSGGAFTARITSCVFGLTATQAGARITGSISAGTLSFSVFADFNGDGSLELVETYTGTKFVP